VDFNFSKDKQEIEFKNHAEVFSVFSKLVGDHIESYRKESSSLLQTKLVTRADPVFIEQAERKFLSSQPITKFLHKNEVANFAKSPRKKLISSTVKKEEDNSIQLITQSPLLGKRAEFEEDFAAILKTEYKSSEKKILKDTPPSTTNSDGFQITCEIDEMLRKETSQRQASELPYNITDDTILKENGGLELINQMNNGYALCRKSTDKLGTVVYILDIHAADERIKFENYLNNVRVEKQRLAIPIELLDLSREQIERVKRNPTVFSRNGFEVAPKDDSWTSLVLKTMPSFSRMKFESTGITISLTLDFYDILDQLESSDAIPSTIILTKVHKKVADLACSNAYRPNMKLSNNDISHILGNLALTKYPLTSPHSDHTVVGIQIKKSSGKSEIEMLKEELGLPL